MIVFFQTMIVAGVGSWLAYALGVPAPFLTGPASFVSLASLFGLKTHVPFAVRDIVFLTIGLFLGTGVTPETLSAAGSWPLSLFAMCVCVALIMLFGAALIKRMLGMDRSSALLAASPGHLSFVLGFSADIGANTALISVIQSMRVLILTLCVPVAITMLTDITLKAPETISQIIALSDILLLAAGAVLCGKVMQKINIPAHYLLGGMLISSIGHGSGLTPGTFPVWLMAGAYTIMGALIGTRFSGVSTKMLRQAAGAGIGMTILGMVLVIITSLLLARFSDLSALSLIIALSPGGFETMAAMSAVVGADPAFVTFHHVARLFFLSAFVPFMLGRNSAHR